LLVSAILIAGFIFAGAGIVLGVLAVAGLPAIAVVPAVAFVPSIACVPISCPPSYCNTQRGPYLHGLNGVANFI
jgi:hypothetical protein